MYAQRVNFLNELRISKNYIYTYISLINELKILADRESLTDIELNNFPLGERERERENFVMIAENSRRKYNRKWNCVLHGWKLRC